MQRDDGLANRVLARAGRGTHIEYIVGASRACSGRSKVLSGEVASHGLVRNAGDYAADRSLRRAALQLPRSSGGVRTDQLEGAVPVKPAAVSLV